MPAWLASVLRVSAVVVFAAACGEESRDHPLAPPSFSHSGGEEPVVLVDNQTHGHYNASLGTALDQTQPQFPCVFFVCGDPNLFPADEPDFSSVASILGDWLANPPALNAYWSAPQAIPHSWAVLTETAVVYQVDAGPSGMQGVTGRFGADNGIFVWVNGVYKFGAVQPGGGGQWEYIVDLGDLPAGANFVQVLREDHGVITSYDIEITGTPAAAFPVQIDIKPGSAPNSINLGDQGRIPVAILTTVDFDAADVDPSTVTLGNDDGNDTPVATRRNGSLMASLEDVDGDADLDLILHFATQALVGNGDLDGSTTYLVVNGETTEGTPIGGSDAVRIVP